MKGLDIDQAHRFQDIATGLADGFQHGVQLVQSSLVVGLIERKVDRPNEVKEQVGGSEVIVLDVCTFELDEVGECKGFLFEAGWSIGVLCDIVDVHTDDIAFF